MENFFLITLPPSSVGGEHIYIYIYIYVLIWNRAGWEEVDGKGGEVGVKFSDRLN